MLIEMNMIMIIFSSLIVIMSSLTDCNKSTPILFNDTCVFGICRNGNYELGGKCEIANKIVKIQWITNVIFIDMPKTIVFFQKYQNGDLILEILPEQNNYTRKFYELKQNEEMFLVKDGEFIPYLTLNSKYTSTYTGNLYLIKIGEDEYPVFFGRYGFGIELYDLKNGIVYNDRNSTILDGKEFNYHYSNIFATNFTLNNINYYLLAYNDKDSLKLKICEFNSKILGNGTNVLNETNIKVETIVSPISCFISDSNIIICMYSEEKQSQNNNNVFWYDIIMVISAYNENLEEQNKTEIYKELGPSFESGEAYKSLHLKGNIGVFLYRTKKICIINYNQEYKKFENYFPRPDFACLQLSFIDNKQRSNPMYYTELLKISDSKVCYISFPSRYGDSKPDCYIFIVLLNFIGTETMIARYYYINMTGLFGYSILYSCKFNIYNDYIALSFSSETDEYGNQTAFMLLSYANNTNQNFDIIDYLLNNNEIKISNISKDLKDYLVIENNIFGYKIERIEILEKKNCDNFDMKLINSDKFIKANSSVEPGNTEFKLNFQGNEIYYKGNCSIKLNLYITEPDFEEYKDYCDNIQNYYGRFDENSYNEQKKIYGGKESIFNIELQKDLFTNCSNTNCELCLMEDPDICITCENKFTFNKELNRKICDSKSSDTISFSNEVTNDTSNIIQMNNSILGTHDINISDLFIKEISDSIKTCNKEELINENLDVNDFLNNKQIEEIFNNLTIYAIKCNNTNESIIIQSLNAIFELSSVEFQKYNDNLNFSSVEFGQCENILRERYNIPNENSLLILKLDLKNIETKSTYVQYEIYDSVTLTKLSLDYCKNLNLKIIIYVPVQLNSTCISLYEDLKNWGYNLFDYGDPFYHDVCTLFTNQFGTDVIIEDRRKDYYLPYNTLQLCQEGCDFNSYDKLIQKAECYCNGQTNAVITDITKLHFDKEIIADIFLDTIKNSNFRVLKCYKAAIDLSTILTNKGRIIFTLIIVLFLVLMIIYYVKEKKKINKIINYVFKVKLMNYKSKIENKPKSKITKKKRKNTKKHSAVFNLDNNKIKKNIINDNKYKNEVKKNSRAGSINNFRNYNSKKRTSKILKNQSTEYLVNVSLKNDNRNSIQKNISGPPKIVRRKIKAKSSISINNNLLNSNNNKLIDSQSYGNISSYIENNQIININSKKTFKKDKFDDTDKYKSKIVEKKSKEKEKYDNDIEDKSIYINMNDQELNTLKYEKALIYDKRSYFQYYWSLLKKKHLMLFTFYPQNDYNLITLKISLFLLGFSLYFTINGFFFSDDSMHKVYVDRGIYNFVYQIPQILYSSIASAIINMILKNLSLSEKNIIELKQEKNETAFLEKSKSISKYLFIKFLIFFILSILLLLFFWYFISCFCGVYVNTQIIFIKNTFISFALSMVYPFGLNLLPGLFRIPALRDKKKKHNCLYKISGYIAII